MKRMVILILGEPKSGKTLTAWALVRRLEAMGALVSVTDKDPSVAGGVIGKVLKGTSVQIVTRDVEPHGTILDVYHKKRED